MEKKIIINWFANYGNEDTSNFIGSIHNNEKIDIKDLKIELAERLNATNEKEVQFLLFTYYSITDSGLCITNYDLDMPKCSLTLVDLTKMDTCEQPLLKLFLQMIMSDNPKELKENYPDMAELIDKYMEDDSVKEIEKLKNEK